MADDLIDGPGDTDAALQQLYARIDAIYQYRPWDEACDQALARVVATHALPKALLHALLEGFRWDADGHGCATLSDVLAYSARVAGSVGVMMALLMGVRERGMLARAADLGVAMQLTNIARDVGEDAGLGRVYLPQEWLREEGLDAESLRADPSHSDALARVIKRLLDEAAALYRRADSGISKLPRSCRPSMYAARLLYAEIGAVIAGNGFDSVSTRAVTSAGRKLQVLMQLPRALVLSRASLELEPLAETEFLVDAASDLITDTRASQGFADSIESQFVWVLDLFEDLHRRETRADELMPAVKRGGIS